MPSIDYFLAGAPDAARAILAEALADEGFDVTPKSADLWEVARGSQALTMVLGGLAGRKNQRLTYSVRFVEHEGAVVARFVREAGAGVMGGAMGVARSNSVFAEVSEIVATRLRAAGHLERLVREAAR